MKHLLAIGIGAALAAANLPAALADGDTGAFIEGKVLPAGIEARITARPAIITKPSLAAAVNPDGSYRMEVSPGTYHVIISAAGYAYPDEEPAAAAEVTVGYGQTATQDFELVRAATISGHVHAAGEGAVMVALRRSARSRSQRLTLWTHVDNATGEYTIADLRPGVYDLLIVAPERGIVEGCGRLLGKPDALSPTDRKAILDLNARYAEIRRRGDYAKMLTLFSKEFSDAAGNTYDTMASAIGGPDAAKSRGVTLATLTWKSLLLQGDADRAIAVVSQVTRLRQERLKTTLSPERTDMLVQYRKEGGAWRLYHMETIRAYREMAARITRLTGHLCVLPPDYVATYSDDVRLGGIEVTAGETSTGHDYAFPVGR